MRIATAGLCLAAGSAFAAPPERAIGPDGVKTCPRMGPGFIEIPGTTTCIRIGGRVVAEAGTGTPVRAPREGLARPGFGTRASVLLDSRTDTELGPLRAVVKMRMGSNGELR